MAATALTSPAALDQQLAAMASKRIYFGHQSVGANILDGIKDVAELSPGATLRIIASSDPASLSGPGLFESPVGENGDPESKNEAFARVLEKGMGAQGGIAFYKYCYVDFSATTDVQKVFASYRQHIDALKAKYHALRIVHVTVPLTMVEPAGKAWVKALLGRETARDANIRRNEFNRLVRETYRDDPIFDLAEIESTHPDGSRAFFTTRGQAVYTLCPEYTTDGGHLNAIGRRRAAEKLIALLAHV